MVTESLIGLAETLVYGFMGIVFTSVPIAGNSVPIIVLWLIAGALFCTVRFGFQQFRSLPLALRLLRGEFNDPDAPGEVSHFQALTSALSVTVGLGNISGVAIAIAIGGPGAVLWMMVAGFLGMATKYAECTLGVKYRTVHADGTVSGGPMYYLKRGLGERGWPRLGAALASFIALAIMLASFVSTNMYQVNQVYTQVVTVTGGAGSFFDENAWLFGTVIAGFVGGIVIGGMQSIAQTTEKLLPAMSLLYVTAALIILIANYAQLPQAMMTILTSAFDTDSVTGGLWGAITQGFIRAMISSEAGMGTSAIAHATARTRFPAAEGHVALLEPFIDTVVICTLTALVIVVTGTYLEEGLNGIEMTSAAYATVLPWFPLILAVSVTLFAFSTILVSCYYGLQASEMLFGYRKRVKATYLIVFLSLTVSGSLVSLDLIVGLMDSLVVLICIPNIIGLIVLAPVIRDEHRRFKAHVHQRDRARLSVSS
ncbi:alanine:cation symporter family protein [Halomonas sp. KAO]|uniref:alanine/glycine:cation symporter family protein n=1 Tax=unclassified Halomonas TaxID=2609666 RepID=UPI00189D54FF|nr:MULTISPECIES: amino acid carrier protein [unclassified Halomonas]MBF7054873.1 alanine:cation symporter family protein [Halomonas sp. KAO]MDT0512788.1 amino acid carrier protein [Halomonas sp. LES1]MDT0591387.1 amino acid carrier protein [Halomonas sp. PAR8]